MEIITLDFETFYGTDYSLTKMTTEDYVRSPKFDTMLVSVKVGRGYTKWFSGNIKQTGEWLRQFDIPGNALLCHHTLFDGLILAHHYGIYPKVYLDTMSMAQAKIKPWTGSSSLAKCLEHANLGYKKGDEVRMMFNVPRAALDKPALDSYAAYCCNDTDATYALFQDLKQDFPRDELAVIDLTLRMYLQPAFELDVNLLAEHLQEVIAKKAALMQQVTTIVTQDTLMSNPRFAAALQMFGAEPPMKTSPTTGKPTYAFAKTDAAWKDFVVEYENDDLISALCAARTGVKSTLEETRTTRLLDMGRTSPLLRVPLRYYAAHTGRYGGTEKINLQNLPGPSKSKIRHCLRAPAGSVVVGADLSQIEPRLGAWLAGELALLNAFRSGVDVYAQFGSRLYGRPITRADKRERFLAKTAVLGLQYGMGAIKYVGTCRAQENIKVDLGEATKVVGVYRDTYSHIPTLWHRLDDMLDIMATPGATAKLGPLTFRHESVELPNGMFLYYPHLEKTLDGYHYLFGRELRSIWGGKLMENIIQALANIVIKECMLRIRRTMGMRPALQVHDELDYIVRVSDVERVAAVIRGIMTAPPAWCKDAPLDVEIHWGKNFGEAK
jgi:DNA polymerase I-like protein with 3'-5' exonuclease and polymerase domains